jgi:hypothetical protein
VKVLYDPSSPERAVVEVLVPGLRLFLPVFLIPFVVLGSILALKFVRVVRETAWPGAP